MSASLVTFGPITTSSSVDEFTACLSPARHATKLDPLEALKESLRALRHCFS
jgi:ABC-type lipoprotein release transport system permease subunit